VDVITAVHDVVAKCDAREQSWVPVNFLHCKDHCHHPPEGSVVKTEKAAHPKQHEKEHTKIVINNQPLIATCRTYRTKCLENLE
jgi:hypothetical protein